MAILGLSKIMAFWNKGYDVMISVYDITNKILSRDSNYIVDVVMCQSLVILAFLWEMLYHNLNFIEIWPEKLLFLRGGLGSNSIIWDWH